ncbi:MAG: type II toxin-antitoxin system RelE/ParE family toxin [Bifidobacteriaceae bacterium]|nr:type II toxin-antitoxin system RelE/ParE family toxin [Bifidobacteriaceae bacterium]
MTGPKARQWRYRIGDYRILALICDDELAIYAFKIGHRSDVYNDR